MAVLLAHDPGQAAHDTGAGHPERPARVDAALAGIESSAAADAAIAYIPRPATFEELVAAHDPGYVARLEQRCLAGGGALDPDTVAARGSYDVAVRAAGAGLEAVERLDAGQADAAFLVLRPPGHHARRDRAMGFCLFNNLAVSAAALLARGERVLVVDWDVHHGNGTQELFFDEAELLFVSLHQWPWYPGTGALDEVGTGPGAGTTINVPLPAGTRGDAYRLAVEELLVPAAEEFAPSWLLVSAGFDAHRDDPLGGVELSAGDFADLARRVTRLAPPGRRLLFLEGGYDLAALAACAGATFSVLAGERPATEAVTTSPDNGAAASGGIVEEVVAAARALHEQASER